MITIIRRTKEQAEQSIARTNYMPTFPMSIIQLVVKILGKGDID
jgi:tellurite resistance protein TehA-like permease